MLGIEDIIVAPPGMGETISFQAMFGDDHPVEVEIGTGKGGFLLRRAQAYPDRRFLGIEWANKICRYVADRMVRHGIENVRLIRTDARHLVMHQMPPECVGILHIYHPDPWPKKRHHKRRLIQPAFLAAVAEILVPGGRVAIQTDHAEYFQQIREVARGARRLEEVPFDVPEAGIVEGRVQTNFEIKYLREGRSIYQLALRKKA